MQSKHANVASQLIDVLFSCLRVEYFLIGDRHIRELRLSQHSLTALVMHGATVHSMFCLIIAFNPSVNATKENVSICNSRVGRNIRVGWKIQELPAIFTDRRVAL